MKRTTREGLLIEQMKTKHIGSALHKKQKTTKKKQPDKTKQPVKIFPVTSCPTTQDITSLKRG